MKELKEFTVERLEEFIDDSENFGSLSIASRDLKALTKIALAAKQGMKQPVCFIGKQMLHDLTEENRSCGRVWISGFDELERVDRIPLYTAPPLNHTEQHMAVPDGWIKCSERMPEEDDEYYITHSKAGVDVTWFYEGHFQDKYATHWMPLPAAPKPEIKS